MRNTVDGMKTIEDQTGTLQRAHSTHSPAKNNRITPPCLVPPAAAFAVEEAHTKAQVCPGELINLLLMKLAIRSRNSPVFRPAGVVMFAEAGQWIQACSARERYTATTQPREVVAVERHPAFPGLPENLGRMLNKERRIVKQHAAGAAADDDPDGHPQQHAGTICASVIGEEPRQSLSFLISARA